MKAVPQHCAPHYPALYTGTSGGKQNQEGVRMVAAGVCEPLWLVGHLVCLIGHVKTVITRWVF